VSFLPAVLPPSHFPASDPIRPDTRPALSSREHQQAAEARRGARQNRELAEPHLRQSLEALGNY